MVIAASHNLEDRTDGRKYKQAYERTCDTQVYAVYAANWALLGELLCRAGCRAELNGFCSY